MYYSLEMSTEYIAKRLLYSHANAEGNIADRISNLGKSEWPQLEKRLLKLAKWKFRRKMTQVVSYESDPPFRRKVTHLS